MKERIIRVINARQATIQNDGKMVLEEIGFDAGEGFVYKGVSNVKIKYDGPKYFSVADSGACLFSCNYFLGEITVQWTPKLTNQFLKAKKLNPYYDPYKFANTDEAKIKQQLMEGFTIQLPENYGYYDLFCKAVENRESIDQWIKLWYTTERISYGQTFFGFKHCIDENLEELNQQKDKLWEELTKKGLVREENTLISPQYLFIITGPVKRACYNHARRYAVEWITPNACLTDKEENFFALIKKCYGIKEFSE